MHFQVPILTEGSILVIPIVAASVSVPVLIALGILLFIMFRRKRYAKQASDLKARYDSVYAMLTTDCATMINRLEVLGKCNNDYAIHFEERKTQYQDILGKKNKRVENALKSIMSEISGKNYRNVKPVLTQCAIDLNNFSDSVNTLSEELNSLLREDSATRDGSVSVKEKYRVIKEYYNSNYDSLKYLEQPFSMVFEEADRILAEYVKYNDQASFDKATEILQPLDQILTDLLQVMNQLPAFEALSHSVIPNKARKIQEEYHKFLSEDFVLNFDADKKVEEIYKELALIDEQLGVLNTDGIKERFDAIQAEITDIQVKFDAERKAKENCYQNKAIINSSTYEIERDYVRILKRLPEYESTFVLDQRYVDQIKDLRNNIDNIGALKRKLDSYMNTNLKQPYSAIYSKMCMMKQEIDKVKMVTEDYTSYLKSLKESSEDVFMGLREYYKRLKKAEYTLRTQIAVNSYTDSQMPKFNELYKKIADINAIVLTTPVDVNKAREAFLPFTRECNELDQEIKKKEAICKSSEIAIVYANAYRKDYVSCRQPLDTAEKSFFEGDFDRAKNIALQIVKEYKVTPSAGIDNA